MLIIILCGFFQWNCKVVSGNFEDGGIDNSLVYLNRQFKLKPALMCICEV